MMQTIRQLSENIGGRGSCTPNERLASEFIADQMRAFDAQNVQIEPFKSLPSTYAPYALSFAVALIGSLASLLFGGRAVLFLASIFSFLGLWGMLAETELAVSWTHWFIPRLPSQNVCGQVKPRQQIQKKVVICAHIDTHRTPIFYSSTAWQSAFSLLVGVALLSMAVGGFVFSLGLLSGWGWLRWISLFLVPIQAFALGVSLHADFTPFSPGANDNASGAAVALAMLQKLHAAPLDKTEVRFAFTGCEEVGDYGMRAYLEAHEAELGKDAFYLIIDEVGSGRLKYLTADGLVIKHRTHPYALEVARSTALRRPELKAYEGVGLAYTDALKATRRGLAALTICTVPEQATEENSNWHKMTDVPENIIPADLRMAYEFCWELLQTIDQSIAR